MIQRDIINSINRIADSFRVLMVTGPRQVGKTTILRSLMPEGMAYVSLDDEVLRSRAKLDPRGFLEEHPWPLMIDEAQYAPELFPYIKMNVDAAGQKSMYWLTGSQQFTLMKGVQESLAGRVGIVEMNSLTYAEINNRAGKVFDPAILAKAEPSDAPRINVNKLYEVVFTGGMPELYAENAPTKSDFFRAYLQTYISRDVEGILNIQDHRSFRQFMRALASYNGEVLNYSNIANVVGISDKTVRAWVNVLVTSGLVYLLEPFYHTNLGQISHMPKVIFMDQGLASYLEGWQSARDLQLSERAGHYFETFIISELIKTYNAHGVEPHFNFFRDSRQAEIDLLIQQNAKIYPFELKKTATPKPEMLKHFSSLRAYAKNIKSGGLVCMYGDLLHLSDKDFTIPASLLISGTERPEKPAC